MDDLADKFDVATRAAEAAADVLRGHFLRPEIEYKADQTQNLVTQADVQAEAAIVDLIRDAFPDHAFLCEESGAQPGAEEAEHLWIIDPLDGTTNFAQGIPQFSTSIAYAQRGVVQLGIVLDPMRQECFSAVSGHEAQLNGQPCRVSARAKMIEAVIATGFYYDRGKLMRRTLQAIDDLFQQNVRGIRRFGGAALDLCWVACGRCDGFFE